MIANPPSLADTISRRIALRTSRRVRELDVEIHSDGVTLRGRTTSFHVKQLAQHGVREVLPDVRIENAIVVESAMLV
jgi:hypothetical protein